jgi:hypothetical protein
MVERTVGLYGLMHCSITLFTAVVSRCHRNDAQTLPFRARPKKKGPPMAALAKQTRRPEADYSPLLEDELLLDPLLLELELELELEEEFTISPPGQNS